MTAFWMLGGSPRLRLLFSTHSNHEKEGSSGIMRRRRSRVGWIGFVLCYGNMVPRTVTVPTTVVVEVTVEVRVIVVNLPLSSAQFSHLR